MAVFCYDVFNVEADEECERENAQNNMHIPLADRGYGQECGASKALGSSYSESSKYRDATSRESCCLRARALRARSSMLLAQVGISYVVVSRNAGQQTTNNRVQLPC